MEGNSLEAATVNTLTKHQVLYHHREDLIDIQLDYNTCLNDINLQAQGVVTMETKLLEDLENSRKAFIAEINENFNDVKANIDRICLQEKSNLEKYEANLNQNIKAIDNLIQQTDLESETVSKREIASREFRKKCLQRIRSIPEIPKRGKPLELALDKNIKWSAMQPVYLTTNQVRSGFYLVITCLIISKHWKTYGFSLN